MIKRFVVLALIAAGAPFAAPIASAAGPHLVIGMKVDKTSALRGETLRYQVNVSNTGDTAATNVQVTSHIPLHTTAAPAECAPGEQCVQVDAGTPGAGDALHQIVFTRIGQLNPGERFSVVFRVRINDDAGVGSHIRNHSHASALNHPEVTSNTVDTLVLRHHDEEEHDD